MRIILATGLRLVNEALASYIEANSPSRVETCVDIGELVARLKGGACVDCVVVDSDAFALPRFEVLQRLRAANATTKILLLTASLTSAAAEALLSAGASAVLPKSLGGAFLLDALTLVQSGRVPAYPADDTERSPLSASTLTRREQALLAHLCAGRSNKEIASDFGLREGTVKLCARSIRTKLGARNRRHLMVLAEQGAVI